MIRIVVVDDEAEFRDEIVFQLRHEGFDAFGVPDGAALFRHLAAHGCDIVILDRGLPGEDGNSIARHLSARDDLGVIMLSAHGYVDDRVEGLASGADAYLVKPADPRELRATIASIMRRLERRGAAAAPAATEGWQLFPQTWELAAPSGERVTLTAYECSLLSLLIARAGSPTSRRDIIESLGHDYRHYDSRRLEAIVSRLRRKLERLSADTTPLQAAHGFGYAFTAKAVIV
ncbi:MAG: response regulator transcription factor [Janthinobacterium lividum]